MATTRDQSKPHPHGGRPRSDRARRKALDAAQRLFESGGYAAATIEAISARSGVAKTTIYRWWPNRAALLVEVLLEMAATAAPEPAGKDPMKAIRTELRLVTQAADALPGQMLLSLLSQAQADTTVRAALREGLFNPRRKATASTIRRAQAEGAIRKEIPPLLAVDMIFGPLFYRRFIRQEPASKGLADAVLRHALDGLAPRNRRRKPASKRAAKAKPRRKTARKRGRS